MDSNKLIVNQSTLTDIADAIRTKTNTSSPIPLTSFKQKILSIDSNGLVFNEADKINSSWQFYKLASTPTDKDYNDATYQDILNNGTFSNINLPHDFSIYNSFNSTSKSTYEGGYLDGGDAWYKKILNTTKDNDMRYFLYFEGIYMESDVIVNGTHLATHKNGYTNFIVDITDNVINGNNTIAVFVKNRQPSSRWYSGSGIYRDVYLLKSGKVGFGQQTVKITTPNLETEYPKDYCTTNVQFTIENKKTTSQTVSVDAVIKYLNSEVILKTSKSYTIPANTDVTKTENIIIATPKLWGVFDGHYYTLELTMKDSNGTTVSKSTTYYGYRWFKFDSNTGFWLNGKNIKLRGACMHHDLGVLGAEINQSAIDRQLRSLKDAGFNAIRLTHNPSCAEYTNACMKYGMMCIEEAFDCWTIQKKPYDYARFFLEHAESDIKSMVKRSRNNPCIIAWSLGNEIYDTKDAKSSQVLQDPTTTVQNLIAWVKSLDTTRPCTMGENGMQNTVAKAVANYLDVQGLNYSYYASYHNSFPNWCIYGSETTSALSSRGVYARDDTNYQCSSYDDDTVTWGSYAYVQIDRAESSAFCAGLFIWTGWDYIGEPTPFNKYPARSSYFGCVDIAGLPKDSYYLYQSMWTDKPMCHIVPMDWSQWTVGEDVLIMVYANASSVKLYLNGNLKATLTNKNISDATSKGSFYATIPFEKGRLVANAYDANNNLIAQDVVYTPYSPSKIGIKSDKLYYADGDLIFAEIDCLDKDGNICTLANNTVSVSVQGGGLIGVDNGDATSVLKYRSAEKPLFNGKAVAVIKPIATSITITATSNGLNNGTLTINKGDMTVYNVETKTFIDATQPYEYIEDTKPCTDLSISPTTIELNNTTKTSTITVTTTPTDTTDNVVYTSSNNDVALVNNGTVTAVNNGTCTITVTCGTQSKTCNVTVSGITVDCTSLTLSDTSVILTDESQHDITATVLPSNCTYEVVWSSSDTDVVAIDNGGHYTAVADGTANLIATCGSKTATCSVVVNLTGEKTLSSISVTKTKTTYEVNETYNYDDFTVTANYTNGTSRVVTDYTLNPQEVNTGLAGVYTVIVDYEEDGVTASENINITVVETPQPSDWDVEWNGEATLPSDFVTNDYATLVLNETTNKYELTTSASSYEASVTFNDRVVGSSIIEVEYETSNQSTGKGWNFGIEVIRDDTYKTRFVIFTFRNANVYFNSTASSNIIGANTVNTPIKVKLDLANANSGFANVYYNDELVKENASYNGMSTASTYAGKLYTTSADYKIKAIRVKYAPTET